MSVPTFEITVSQILDWCQVGRLAGGSDAQVGQYLVISFASRFDHPMNCVRVYCNCACYEDAISTIELLGDLNNRFGKLGYEYEIWQVRPEPRVKRVDRDGHVDLLESLVILRDAGVIDAYGCAYCGSACEHGMRICRGPVGMYCVCGSCYRIPQLRHGMAVV